MKFNFGVVDDGDEGLLNEAVLFNVDGTENEAYAMKEFVLGVGGLFCSLFVSKFLGCLL